MARKARNKTIVRGKSKRADYEKILIVCEGKKTEPNYFNGIKDDLRISGANMRIDGKGATPMKIIKRAKQLCREEQSISEPFDRVFCVFDRNSHSDYEQALKSVGSFFPITSIPCFEYWLLLHFTYTTKHYETADEVISDLKNHISNYQKGEKNIFGKLKHKTDNAKNNAKRSLDAAESANTDNPSTRVHELVYFLQNLKKP